MAQRRPTRKDVALRAGVAPSTVSLVLQDRGDDLRIPKSTQQRVREAARSLGYYRNWHIESMMSGRTGVLGLYLRADQWAEPVGFWSTMIWHIQCAVAEADLRVLIHNAREGCPAEEAFARHSGGIVDGVMILNSGADPIVARIIEAKLPSVEIGDPFSPLPFVGSDGAQGIKLALAHLHERGYRRPALLSHISNYAENMEVRRIAFRDYGEPLFGMEMGDRVLSCSYGEDIYSMVMAMRPRPDCVVCASDQFAYEILRACIAEGRRVPEDLAIIGFDSLPAFGQTRELTSVASPLREITELAVAKLLAVIEAQPYDHGTLLPSTLKIGDTT
jgi:DNA-binding LacI/PurR family transcriptional regulator